MDYINTFTPEQEAWLTALESGKYEQVRKALTHIQGCSIRYCCLGVAVRVIDPDHYSLRDGEWSARESASLLGENEDDFLEEFGEGEGSCAPEIYTQLRLLDDVGSFRAAREHHGVKSLLELNDYAEFSFSDIAAFIRNKPWAVFANFDHPDAA